MGSKIERYINDISKFQYISCATGEIVNKYDFRGDGQGDFEDISDKTTKECLENYIAECEKQIEIAKECLDIFKE